MYSTKGMMTIPHNVFNWLTAIDAGLSIGEHLSKASQKLVPGFLYKNDYYFKEVNKKVFVKNNGDGLVVTSCELYVIRPENVKDFIRTFDISDAKKQTRFPRFNQMCRKNFKCFSDYAFVWSSDIITSVDEYYEDDISVEDIKKRNDGKLLGLKFYVDSGKLKPKESYKIVYGYSVPGLFPIKNGKHDTSEYKSKDYVYTSSLAVQHMAIKSKISVYLEKGIVLKDAPQGNAIKISDDQATPQTHCSSWDNVLYKKYLYEIKRPEKYSAVQIKWKLK